VREHRLALLQGQSDQLAARKLRQAAEAQGSGCSRQQVN